MVLYRGSDRVPLPPKALDLLHLFLSSPGEVLTREALQARLWPDVVVEDAALHYGWDVAAAERSIRSALSLNPHEVALIHLGLGEREEALGWLERARTRRSGWMAYMEVDPRLDPLRAEPRFQVLSREMAIRGRRAPA